MTALRFTLLGTGSSGGVPRIGNDWGACDPTEPRNRRRRCALLMTREADDGARTTVLVDAGCDMREQLIDARVERLDGVVITHAHADHIFGLDDLRQVKIRMRECVDVYLDDATSERVMQAFDYCFRQPEGSSYPPICIEHRIEADNPFEVDGAGGPLSIRPLQVEHGDIHALGVRVGDFAYVPDIKTVLRASSRAALSGLEVLVLDALRRAPHPSHLNVEEALALIDELRPRRTVLTNMHTDLDYATLSAELPDGIEVGFDGLEIVLS
ncbi:MAG: MBL fold metallo-hydrolase [Pseudomonadota bacterium]